MLRKPGVIARFIWETITVGPSNDRWTVLNSGVSDAGRIDFDALLDSSANADIEGLTEWFGVTRAASAKRHSEWENVPEDRWPLPTVWEQISAGVVIPYDLESRKRQFRGAYETMASLISYYERLKEKRATPASESPDAP